MLHSRSMLITNENIWRLMFSLYMNPVAVEGAHNHSNDVRIEEKCCISRLAQGKVRANVTEARESMNQ